MMPGLVYEDVNEEVQRLPIPRRLATARSDD